MNITPISTYLKRFLSFSDSSIPSQQHISDIKNYTLTQDVFSLKSSNDCKSSQTVYNLFMKTKGYTYIDLLSEYQGTPSFSSPIFTFDDGKFNMTYTTN